MNHIENEAISLNFMNVGDIPGTVSILLHFHNTLGPRPPISVKVSTENVQKRNA
jgi:hypothetical protein